MDRRRALKLLGGLSLGMVAAGCGQDDDDATSPSTITREPVRIGVLAPRTGAFKAVGAEITNGFQLYLDLNGGRFGPHPVEVVKADEGDTVGSGRKALEELLARQVAAVIGVANSALLADAQGRIEEARVPVMSTNGTPKGSRTGFYIWSTSYAEQEPGQALAPYVAGVVDKTDVVAIVAPSTTSGRDAVEAFRFAFGVNGPRLAPTIWTPPQAKVKRQTFARAAEQLVDLDAAAVFCYYTGTAAVEFVRAVRQSGSRATIYGPGTLTEGTVLSELGGEAEGIMTAMNYSTDLVTPANRRFAALYRRTHGSAPSATALAAYEAAQAVDKAIQLMGTPPSAWTVYEGLYRTGQVDSPRGLWQFNLIRTPSQRWYLRQVRRDGPLLSNVTVADLTTLG